MLGLALQVATDSGFLWISGCSLLYTQCGKYLFWTAEDAGASWLSFVCGLDVFLLPIPKIDLKVLLSVFLIRSVFP